MEQNGREQGCGLLARTALIPVAIVPSALIFRAARVFIWRCGYSRTLPPFEPPRRRALWGRHVRREPGQALFDWKEGT